MLFGYPVEATNDNWFHECLCEAINAIHSAVDADCGYPGWPNVLPAKFRRKLNRCTGLRDRLADYDREIRRLSTLDRLSILRAVVGQNKIPDLLSGICKCDTITDLPKNIHKVVIALFHYGYERLKELGICDSLYGQIYESSPDHICPFCGVEYMDAPGARREDMDHYLAKSLYPFAAANLRNLVPMGIKCNQRYKLAVDILCGVDGSRRMAIDPYNHAKTTVILDNSDPFNGASPYIPKWEISFDPGTPAVSTWDEVFKVKERYCRDHLDPSFNRWLCDFSSWAQASGLRPDGDTEIVDALKRYEQYHINCGMQDRAFLKAAVFRMLRCHCESGHQRLLCLLKDLLACSREL